MNTSYGEDLRALGAAIYAMAGDAERSSQIAPNELRRLLVFLGKVCEVVEQSFRGVGSVLALVRLLDPDDAAAVTEARSEVARLLDRAHYRDAEIICARLHALSDQYRDRIRTIAERLGDPDRFHELLYLLDEHEGRVIMLVGNLIRELDILLSDPSDRPRILEAKSLAEERLIEIRQLVEKMQGFNNRVLGLSGDAGWIELTETDRDQIGKEISLVVNQDNRNYSRTMNIGGNAQVGVAHQGDQSAVAYSPTPEGMTKQDLERRFEELRAEIEAMDIAPEKKEEAGAHLTLARLESMKDKPDLGRVKESIEQVTGTIKSAGGLIESVKGFGRLLLPVAKWVGLALF